MDSIRDWLESKYIPEPNSGCWIWIGAVTAFGYGDVRLPKKFMNCLPKSTRIAHRIAYFAYENELPPLLDHRCRTRLCVNPKHLRPVTQWENVRNSTKTTAVRTHCPRGHEYDFVGRQNGGKHQLRRCRECHCKQQMDLYRRQKGQG